MNFAQKSLWARMSISPTSRARRLQRSVCLKSYTVQKEEVRFTLELNIVKNMRYMKKKFRIKVVQNWILYKKVRERICLSPPRVELDSSKDQYVNNLIIYRNWILDSLRGLTLPKTCITLKKDSNKSCAELNFIRKSP